MLHTLTLGSILRWLIGIAVATALVWYGIYQARFLIAGPSLALSSTIPVAQASRVITISGTAYSVTEITLNGRPIFTDDEGRFNELLVLEEGYTIMTIRAKDRYGREKLLTHPFVYAPAYESAS